MEEQVEMFLEEIECISAESPEERAAIESEMHKREKRARFAQWHAAQVAAADFYERRFGHDA